MSLTEDDTRRQSESAYGQWAPQWRGNAKKNSKFEMKPLRDFQNIGLGKAVLCIANGYSFEKDVKKIKEMQGKVDILVCDKTLGHCLDNGIKPTYCLVCDANVDYEKYMKPWEDQLEGITLFSNVCGNPKWTHSGNWEDIYFFVNMDIIKSEKEFSELSGCANFIPAGTNVSNAMVVFLTQSDQTGRRNFFGYDKILLTGFDYSWKRGGKYYAFSENGNGKNNYMRHVYLPDADGDMVYTSSNLLFSAQWLDKYISTFKLPIVQCSKGTILPLGKNGKLEEQIDYSYKREDREIVKKMVLAKSAMKEQMAKLDKELDRIGKDHYFNFVASV